MNGDWRVWRPAIWLVMLGIAVALLVSPWYISAVFFGAAIGAAIRIRQRRRGVAVAGKDQPQRGRRSGRKR
jgi:uncharacterized membrane protein YdbT with pleckstrin-like domain